MERIVDFSNYKFRCSSLGKLMTNSRSKSDPLSQTTKTYLHEIHKEAVFNRRKEIQSKYLNKGIQVEEQSITLYSNVTNKLFLKNEDSFENEFIKGTPDNTQGMVRDIKSSWDFSTFPMYEDNIPNKMYYWQLQGYMELTGFDLSELIYCLVDTPDLIIQDEKRRTGWKLGFMELPLELDEEIETNLVFRDIPEHLRVKVFQVKKNEEDIQNLYERIGLCREYLNNLSLTVSEKLQIAI